MQQNVYSDFKLLGFPEKIDSFREGRITAPIYVRIKPTNFCPMDCWWCVYAQRYRKPDRSRDKPHLSSSMHGHMSFSDSIPPAKLLEVIEDLRDIGTKAVTYSGGGEPLAYPDIVRVMAETLHAKLKLSIITNGSLLDEDRAEILGCGSWVRVSMDYCNAEQMMQSRGVSLHHFQTVISNLKTFARTKNPTCNLGVNFIVTHDNVDRLYEVASLLKDVGVENVRFSPLWTGDFVAYHTQIHNLALAGIKKCESLSDRTFVVHSSYYISNPAHSNQRGYPRCWYMQTVPAIGADQCVYACHNKAYDRSGLIGSIANRRFRDLWFSDETKTVFQSLDPRVVCHHQCANDSKNALVQGILDAPTDPFV